LKIIIAPDKFKGSLSSQEVCNAVEKGILKVDSSVEIKKIPIADGGEGSLKVLQNNLNFEKIIVATEDPLFRPITTYYGLSGNVAFIEVALASGLQLLNKEERNPMFTSTFGTGKIILDAIKKGAKEIFLFVGGTATTDAGIGIASAFGVEFIDGNNNKLKPIGKNLEKIKTINTENAIDIKNVQLKIFTDVTNKLTGKQGAAYFYALQKGATADDVKHLENGLKNYSNLIEKTFGIKVSKVKGSGAGGGIIASLLFMGNVKIENGIHSILNILNFDYYLMQSDLVITGEGLLDNQTLKGKTIKGIVERCKQFKKPVAIICGDVKLRKKELNKLNAVSVISVKTKNLSHNQAMNNAYNLLIERATELFKIIRKTIPFNE